MPIYTFSNPKTGEVKEILLKMSGPIIYSENGVVWTREYDFNIQVKGEKLNPWKKNDFLKKTGEMKGTVGDMWELSAELSHKREEETGQPDPIKKQYFKEYSKKRGGKRHLEDR